MSFKKTLYKAIQSRIDPAAGIRFIALDFGQIDNYDTRPPVSWPCVLIDFPSTTPNALTRGRKTVVQQVTIRLAVEAYSPINNLTPTVVLNKALEFFDIEENLINTLTATALPGIGNLIHVGSELEKRDDAIRVQSITFSIQATVTSGQAATSNVTGPVPYLLDARPTDQLPIPPTT